VKKWTHKIKWTCVHDHVYQIFFIFYHKIENKANCLPKSLAHDSKAQNPRRQKNNKRHNPTINTINLTGQPSSSLHTNLRPHSHLHFLAHSSLVISITRPILIHPSYLSLTPSPFSLLKNRSFDLSPLSLLPPWISPLCGGVFVAAQLRSFVFSFPLSSLSPDKFVLEFYHVMLRFLVLMFLLVTHVFFLASSSNLHNNVMFFLVDEPDDFLAWILKLCGFFFVPCEISWYWFCLLFVYLQKFGLVVCW